MADDDRASEDRKASLELPRLRSAFRRRRVGAKMVKPTAESSYDDSAGERRARLRPSLRLNRHLHRALRVPGPVAAVVTGAVVGLVLVGLTSAGLHGCRSVRGTSSCGTPGILVLLLITVAAIVLGSLLLRLAGVAAHGSTSLLGVGLLVVVILLALLPVLDDGWAVVVVPALAMAAYAAAWWLTTAYPDAGE